MERKRQAEIFISGYQKETLSHKQNANKKASYFDIFNRYHPFSSQDLGKNYLTFHKLSFYAYFFTSVGESLPTVTAKPQSNTSQSEEGEKPFSAATAASEVNGVKKRSRVVGPS